MKSADKKERLNRIKEDIGREKFEEAFLSLKRISEPEDAFFLQHKYCALFNSIPKDVIKLTNVRIAILAGSTVTHFVAVFKYWLAQTGLSAVIYEAGYDTVSQSILDPASSLYSFAPDITMIFTSYRDLKFDVGQGASIEDSNNAVEEAVEGYVTLWEQLKKNSSTFIIQNNADLPSCRTLGNYEGTAPWGRVSLLRAFNVALAKAVQAGVALFDLEYISSVYGKRKWHDSRFWYHSKHAFSLDATGLVAFEAARLVGSIKGFSKKCLVLDLDNTLWGGIIGDDGVHGIVLGNGAAGEAFVDFQQYLLGLKNRGIILTVCSKNEEELAKEPFLQHPDMQLKLEDIAVFKANWEDKVANISAIADELNIGLEHMVFVDDNPAEREIVRKYLPMVAIPDMPEDPSGYIEALDRHCYFEVISFSDADQVRNEYYRDNVSRKQLRTQSRDLTEYLQSLRMEATVSRFDDLNLARIAQLINKSNQFHLTTTRYTETEIAAMMSDKQKHCLYFRLKDCFGDNGLISVVILEEQEGDTLYIDTWSMSCRVFARGMEQFIANEIVLLARQRNVQSIIGKYVPTRKNKIVSDLYEKLHFSLVQEQDGVTMWELPLTGNPPVYETYINKLTLD